MKKFLQFVLVIIASCLFVDSYAEGICVGYCDGVLGTSAQGQLGTNVVIQEAIMLTPDMFSAYPGAKIATVRAGLVEKASTYPDSITVWVRTERDGENIVSVPVKAHAGWNDVKLENPISLSDYADKDLWIGFSYKQGSKKLSVLAFGGEKNVANAGWICKNGTWTNYSHLGVLSIEVELAGDHLPQNDLCLMSAEVARDIVKVGDNLNVSATVKNLALQPAVKPVIKYNLNNGAYEGIYEIDQTLNYRERTTVNFSVPTSAVTQELATTLALSVQWADGREDDNVSDNGKSLNVSFVKDFIMKKMLVEEGTGAWCGWCVRGLVGLATMREKYPDSFIAIGVHNGDAYVVSEYDRWMNGQITGYPACVINRSVGPLDPSYDVLNYYYNSLNYVADAEVKVSAKVTGTELVAEGVVTFAKNSTDTYNMVYVIVEDSLPITQSNYYSGGSNGVMGGFEKMGSYASVFIDDVARGVYPSPKGMSAGFPAEIQKGQPMNVKCVIKTLPVIVRREKCRLVAILVDSQGAVVNAEECRIDWSEAGAEPSAIDTLKASESESSAVFNLSGVHLSAPQKGINIVGGKKMIMF